ncbi:MAG: hypothetical protein Q4E81_01700 [Succinatimonas sp.]|nr:hypothetical protein [Succinatimonas sp.]
MKVGYLLIYVRILDTSCRWWLNTYKKNYPTILQKLWRKALFSPSYFAGRGEG